MTDKKIVEEPEVFSKAALERVAVHQRPRFGRKNAEAALKKALGLKQKDKLPVGSIRALLSKGGQAPRHDAMYELIGKLYDDIGFGGISTLHAKRYIHSIDDILHYLARMRVPVE